MTKAVSRSVQRLLVPGGLVLNAVSSAWAQNNLDLFVTRSGNRLMEGDQEYRFVSINVPTLHLHEDNMAFRATTEWRYPDEFEIKDALLSAKQLGGRVVRTYVISVCSPDGTNPVPGHVTRPGEFNEEAFLVLDKVLEVANRTGMRVVIPLVDQWKWWGGVEQYAQFRGKAAAGFWSDQDIISDFKRTVSYVLNRKNTFTGVAYKDDKAIMAWETGNELLTEYAWTKEIAAFIKSIDANHLVWDGHFIGRQEMHPEVLDDPNIDIVSSHHYPHPDADAFIPDIRRYNRQIGGKKVYVVGEFGFVSNAKAAEVLDTVIEQGLAGAMIWSLRGHNRDGGFYWHFEPFGAGTYKAYHFPGFQSGAVYDETGLLELLRTKAYQISGLPVPAIAAPEMPVLLPIPSVGSISWQGSVGATAYDVERSTSPVGPWVTIGYDVDDAAVQYQPLFSDPSAVPGKEYFYRIVAKNVAGKSAPSAVSGPVSADAYYLIDNCADLSKVYAHGGDLAAVTSDARQYKEDAHRLKGDPRSWLTYRTSGPLLSARLFTFLEGDSEDFEFFCSADGIEFRKVESQATRFPSAANLYDYKLPVLHELERLPGSFYLKIIFKGAAQIGRVEIRSGTELSEHP